MTFTTSLPEVIGDAGVFVDPNNEENIFGALDRVIKDKKLHDKLVRQGTEQVRQFTWTKTVEGILQVLTGV